MTKYKVTSISKAYYTVEADSEEEAIEKSKESVPDWEEEGKTKVQVKIKGKKED